MTELVYQGLGIFMLQKQYISRYSYFCRKINKTALYIYINHVVVF